MLWLAGNPVPLPAVLHELGFAPDTLTLTMEGLEIRPHAVHIYLRSGASIILNASVDGTHYRIQLLETAVGWIHYLGSLDGEEKVTWWKHATTDFALPQTAREALEEAVFLLVGTTDDARLEAMEA